MNYRDLTKPSQVLFEDICKEFTKMLVQEIYNKRPNIKDYTVVINKNHRIEKVVFDVGMSLEENLESVNVSVIEALDQYYFAPCFFGVNSWSALRQRHIKEVDCVPFAEYLNNLDEDVLRKVFIWKECIYLFTKQVTITPNHKEK